MAGRWRLEAERAGVGDQMRPSDEQVNRGCGGEGVRPIFDGINSVPRKVDVGTEEEL